MVGVGKLCCKGLDRKFFRLCGLYTVSPIYSPLLLEQESSHKQYVNRWELQCSNKTFLQNQVTGPFDLWTVVCEHLVYVDVLEHEFRT